MGKVKVYYFKTYDITRDRTVRSKRPATLSAIRALGPAMQPIPETEHEIDSALLDKDGFRKRLTAREVADVMISKNKERRIQLKDRPATAWTPTGDRRQNPPHGLGAHRR